MNILTIGQLASEPEINLVTKFGKSGRYLSRHARGIDETPIITSHDVKSISQETTFARDVRDEAVLRSTLLSHCQNISRRLFKQHLSGTTVKIKIRWPDFSTLTRQVTTENEINTADQIYEVALSLFLNTWKPGKPVRLLGVGISGFKSPSHQLSFWDQDFSPTEDTVNDKKQQQLEAAIAELQLRFGDKILFKGFKQDKEKHD